MTPMSSRAAIIVAFLCALSLWYSYRWYIVERARGAQSGTSRRRPGSADIITGFATDFFDTLGIGSFAPTTAIFKLLRRMPDEEVPGTLNAGHALPNIAEAVIFIAIVNVDFATLSAMILASAAGAWFGVGIVSRLPRRAIQVGMGSALLVSALLFAAANLKLMPGGGTATSLSGGTLVFSVAANFLLGGLMMLGVGLYAPCLIMVSLLGMSPLAAFPIMMGSCALLMGIGGARFVSSGRYNFPAALGLTLGGIPGVLVAAFLVKSLPLQWLRWMVVFVVIYAAVLMLAAARSRGTQKGRVHVPAAD